MARDGMRKKTVYLTDDVLAEILSESERLDRSVSKMLLMAWRLARARVTAMPVEPSSDDSPRPTEASA